MTSELSIAVRTSHRCSGVGTAMLSRLLAGVARLCLSVDVRNQAMRLYERNGSVEVRREGFSATMSYVR